MLSIFPPLLTFDGFAPVLLRITLAVIFIIWGYKEVKSGGTGKNKLHGSFQLILGVMFFIGLLTQLAALASVVFFGIKLINKIRTKSFLTDGVNYYLILFIISITLLFTGPGFISFDLPL